MIQNEYKTVKLRGAVRRALGTAVAVPLLFAAVPAMAQGGDAVQNLRNQIQQLRDRLDMLETQQSSDGNTIQLGGTSISVSGYVKLDAFYDFEADEGTSLLPSDVFDDPSFYQSVNDELGPVIPSGHPALDEDAHLGWTAKQTRLRISTNTPTKVGDVGGYIEMDMYGESGTTAGGAPRLRQAYLTWNNWLFGRSWTTFANFHYGTTLNFAGPAGQVFGRREQIRYTVDLGNGSNFAIALEDDEGLQSTLLQRGVSLLNTVAGPLGGGPIPLPPAYDGIETSLPALAMRYQGSAGMLSYQVAGYAHQIEAQNLVTGEEDSKFGWGLNVGGTLGLASGTTLKLSAAYGEGIGGLVYSPAPVSVYTDSDGDLQTAETLGVIASVGQQLTDNLSANLIYGYGKTEVDDIFLAPDLDVSATGQSIAANLLYSPVDALVFGIEYTYVDAELEVEVPGDSLSLDGDANRVQFSAIYNF